MDPKLVLRIKSTIKKSGQVDLVLKIYYYYLLLIRCFPETIQLEDRYVHVTVPGAADRAV